MTRFYLPDVLCAVHIDDFDADKLDVDDDDSDDDDDDDNNDALVTRGVDNGCSCC
jgi:hypothetical protein